jgi:hypothetical protein
VRAPVLLFGALLAAALAPSAAAGTLTATGVRIGDHPAFVRVVVDFSGAGLRPFDPTLLDARLWGDGRTRLEVARPGIRTSAPAARAEGVRVSLAERRRRIAVRVAAAGHRFKYLSYRVLTAPARLAVDLWKARPPVAGAQMTDDGCLRLTRVSIGPKISIRGRELRPLFEHTVVVRVRDRDGREMAVRPLIASNGRWGTSFPLSVPRSQIATLEASAQSAKDGSLECLVQVRVLLPGGR